MIKKIYLILKQVLFRMFTLIMNSVILVLSSFIPKTSKIIIVGGWFGERFADNSKHFFLYANNKKLELGIDEIIWVTRNDSIKNELRDKGLKAFKMWSLHSIWFHLRAKIHIVDQSHLDINSFFSVRSIRINLWHGFPLKKIGAYRRSDKKAKNSTCEFLRDFSIPGFWGRHFLLATSDFAADILREAFSITREKVLISGYPRNYDSFERDPIKYTPLNEIDYLNLIKQEKNSGKKIIGYFPTFRDKKDTLIFGTKDGNELKGVLDYFQELNITVIGKFHFAGKGDRFEEMHNHEAFINLSPNADVYSFLRDIDILITDYSSIYFDFLLWDRPMIFFPYDLEYYRDEDRGLIFEYDEYTPGPKVFSIKELKILLEDGVENFVNSYMEKYQGEAAKLKVKIFGNPVEKKIKHLVEQIMNLK